MEEYRQQRFERPEGATEILLVRHGESQTAVPNEPFPLVDRQGGSRPGRGGQGAGKESRGEASIPTHRSSLCYKHVSRTQETAAPLCAHLGLKPTIVADLKEVHLGDWETGVFRIKAHQQDPIFVQMQEEQRWDLTPGAESLQALQERVQRGLRQIASGHRRCQRVSKEICITSAMASEFSRTAIG